MRFLDTTLRDGEQTPGVSLTPEEKVWIARNLDSLGVDVIEAGSAITSQGERDGIKAVVKEGLRAEICSFARPLKPDLDYAIECGVDSVHLVISVSDLHIKEKLKKDHETVKRMAVDAVEYAKKHGLIVELSGEDASRANLDYPGIAVPGRHRCRRGPALLLRYGRRPEPESTPMRSFRG